MKDLGGAGEARSGALFAESHASVFAPDNADGADRPKSTNPIVADRYRLVTLGLAEDPSLSMAFIEHIQAKTQKCYHPGELIEDGVKVVEVTDNGVLLDTPDGAVMLSFGIAGNAGPANSGKVGTGIGDGAAAAARSFGGRRTGTNEWHFSRDAVMAYYDELKSRPERLVAVFDTMAPVYGADERIEGYKVDIQGEAEFFKAIGFNPGDIVREVNGIPLTNRRAAEKLIRRYADDDLDFIGIKMERDGKPVQQVYHSK